MARPTKLTPDVQERLAEAISLGATYEQAAHYAGIDYATFRRWMASGEARPGGVHGDFYQAIKQAAAKATVGWLAVIEKAGREGDWRAAAWKLERRYPHDYGRLVHELTGPNAGPMEVKSYDYRNYLGAVAPRPDGDRQAPGEDEGPRDGSPLG